MKLLISAAVFIFSVNVFACKMTHLGFQQGATKTVFNSIRENKSRAIMNNLEFITNNKISAKYTYYADGGGVIAEGSIYTIAISSTCEFSIADVQIIKN